MVGNQNVGYSMEIVNPMFGDIKTEPKVEYQHQQQQPFMMPFMQDQSNKENMVMIKKEIEDSFTLV